MRRSENAAGNTNRHYEAITTPSPGLASSEGVDTAAASGLFDLRNTTVSSTSSATSSNSLPSRPSPSQIKQAEQAKQSAFVGSVRDQDDDLDISIPRYVAREGTSNATQSSASNTRQIPQKPLQPPR